MRMTFWLSGLLAGFVLPAMAHNYPGQPGSGPATAVGAPQIVYRLPNAAAPAAYLSPAAASAPAPQIVYRLPAAARGPDAPMPALVATPAPSQTHTVMYPWDGPLTGDSLRTTTGIELGFQFGHYHYQERNLPLAGQTVSIEENALKYGFTGTAVANLGADWFVKADGRFALGDASYNGYLQGGSAPVPETTGDIPNYIAEIRAFVGHDFVWGNVALSPMTGIGYRYLFDNQHDSSVDYGYGRQSQYMFWPLALNPRLRFGNGDILSLLAEYDYLIYGNQKSYLGDLPFPAPGYRYTDISNDQHGGYGLRGDLMYRHQRFSIGPYLNYWNIDSSDAEPLDGGVEPHNQTFEYGLQVKYRLL